MGKCLKLKKMLLIKNFTRRKVNQKYLNKVVEKALKVSNIKKPVEISLVITGEKRIKSLNNRYRKIDKVTDVLSFGNEERCGAVRFIDPMDNTAYLGEIFICYPQAERQAEREKHVVQKEIAILLVHGILHLLGHDHKKDEEAEIMEKKEGEIRKELFV